MKEVSRFRPLYVLIPQEGGTQIPAIGGADGHHPDFLKKADKKIAFGRTTWPHMLCRAMLAEQLYRAEMILANHPYHRG